MVQYMVQNSGAVEIWQLNPSQPFTSTHFHFLIIAESATSHVVLQRPEQLIGCVLPAL
jgi:hypothetical protein